MKQFITILLLLVMAVQTTSHFCQKPSPFYSVQDIDEKNDDESKKEKKEAKEYVSHALPFHLRFNHKAYLLLTQVSIISSPVTDHLTPPPDKAFARL